ncbi:MAG: 16S rRNA (cytidine(1402)-2'-O)-methyltransferase [Desulfuromonas sp.]|nr:MAG: 16S rRNA (cytidine(1402)-2'-O)-methyltransferase [Desulfuromonas sp.]
MPGILYLVATPIGNLEDITLRALRILKEVDLVAAEDTRHSRKLFNHYDIRTPLTSYHQHNESEKGEQLLVQLHEGKQIALVSDAGTPAISDPGYLLVARCRREGITVNSVPGPSAGVAALAVSGLPVERFAFEGFLPPRSKGRCETLRTLAQEKRTLIFYEAPHRLLATLSDLRQELGDEREVVVARELTKLHEEIFCGRADAAAEHFSAGRVRGEIVLLVAPARDEAPEEEPIEMLQRLRREGELSRKEMTRQVAKCFSLPGSDVYRLSLDLDAEEEGAG